MEVAYEERHLSVGIVIEAGVLGLSGLCISLAFFIFNVRLRANRVVKMSSPILNLFIACGGILFSACCALFGLDYFMTDFADAASAVCQTRAGLLACGSTLLFGPMCLKAWRVHRLFKNAGKKRVIIKDCRLLTMTGMMLLADLLLMVIWQTTDPLLFRPVLLYRQMEPESADATQQNASSTTLHQLPQIIRLQDHQVSRVHVCTSATSPSWVTAFLVLKAALLGYGLFLSWQTRFVALPSMNDSRCLVVSSLTAVTMATLALSVSHVLHERPNAVYACVVLCVWLCTVVALCTAFVPKVALWWRNPEAKGLRLSLNSSCSTAQLHPVEHLEEELGQAAADNEALRKSLEEKDTSIRQLQQHLTNAHKRLSHLGQSLDWIQDSGLDADFSSSSDNNNNNDRDDGDNNHDDSTDPSHHQRHHHSQPRQDNSAGSKHPPTITATSAAGEESGRRSGSHVTASSSSSRGAPRAKGSRSHRSRSSEAPRLTSSGSSRAALLAAAENEDVTSRNRPDPAEEKGGERKHRVVFRQGSSSADSVSSSSGGDKLPGVFPSPSEKDGTAEARSSSSTGVASPRPGKARKTSMTSPTSDDVNSAGFPFFRADNPESSRRRPSCMSEPSAQTLCPSASSHSNVDGINDAVDDNVDDYSRRQMRKQRQRQRRRRHDRRYHSVTTASSSISSLDRLAALRVAIAQDLQHARSLSNVLGNSLSKDLHNLERRHSRRRRRRSSSAKPRDDLAGSIVGSLGLDDSFDTLSYVNSFLSLPTASQPVLGDVTATNGDVRSVLDNDMLYPDPRRQKDSVTSLLGMERVQGPVDPAASFPPSSCRDEKKYRCNDVSSGSSSREKMKVLDGLRKNETNRRINLRRGSDNTKPQQDRSTSTLYAEHRNDGQRTFSRSESFPSSVSTENADSGYRSQVSPNSESHVQHSAASRRGIISSYRNSCPPPQVAGCVQDCARSAAAQGRSGRTQEVFSVQIPRNPNFVQAGYAQTRALYTVDTFI